MLLMLLTYLMFVSIYHDLGNYILKNHFRLITQVDCS